MTDPSARVMAVATAMAKAAVNDFIRISGGEGTPWDDLTPDRQQRAVRSQIRYAQIAVDEADSTLRREVTRLWGETAARLSGHLGPDVLERLEERLVTLNDVLVLMADEDARTWSMLASRKVADDLVGKTVDRVLDRRESDE